MFIVPCSIYEKQQSSLDTRKCDIMRLYHSDIFSYKKIENKYSIDGF